MISCVGSVKNVADVAADVKVLFVAENASIESRFQAQLNEHFKNPEVLLNAHKFTGKKGDFVSLSTVSADQPFYMVLVGLGKKNSSGLLDFEVFRNALGNVVKFAKKIDAKIVSLGLSGGSDFGMTSAQVAQQATIVATMATYVFDDYKDIKKEKKSWNVQFVFCGFDESQAISDGTIIAQAINKIRRYADAPANIATPTYLAEEARKIADQYGLSYTCFGKERALELGMGGLLAVGAGSAQPFKFVTMEYSAPGATQTIALVGKGITFDTGGVSLKPANYMTGMKYDMSGAAAVFGAMQIIAQLKPAVNVVGITPLTENMPDGAASRQDDIIVHMNGVTSEIENTDAEGRLILGDALCYAEQFFKPDFMIDIATLTGACSHALGTFYAGMMTDDDALADQLFKIGKFVGDKVWRLPFDEVYNEGVKSDVADIANSGKKNYYAGTIIGGVYLRHFVKNARWAHLDIAGVADGVPGVSYVGSGATGAGVRLFVEFIKQIAG
ncbi:leucyl aminopeptidase family protein [Candidatus Dependentiae bacterium]|nr:leucyl aminopeptidase family protein [Candidatus Dependentiae bacterium]